MSRRYDFKNNAKQINALNYRVKKSIERIERDFGIKNNRNYVTPKNITNQREANAYIKQQQRFLKEARKYRYNQSTGVKYTPKSIININNVEFSKKEVEKLKKQTLERNRIKRNEFKRLGLDKAEFKSRGVGIGITAGERLKMGDTRYSEFKPIKFNVNTIYNKTEYKKKMSRIKYQNTQKYKRNKIKTFIDNYKGVLVNSVGPIHAEKLLSMIDKMSNDEFLKLYYTEDIMSHVFLYGSNNPDDSYINGLISKLEPLFSQDED